MSIPLLLAATFRFNQPGKMTLIGKRKLLKEVIIFLKSHTALVLLSIEAKGSLLSLVFPHVFSQV